MHCGQMPNPSIEGTSKGYRPRPPLMSNVCAVHGTNPAGWKSRHQVSAEPKVSQRASASSRGGVRRKPKTKSRGDEQELDMRRDASGASGHVTTKPSICNTGGNAGVDAFCKSSAYARKDSCLTTGDLRDAWRPMRHAGRRATDAEDPAEVSRGHSRPRALGRRPERCERWARA
jgi:hypothetical protein